MPQYKGTLLISYTGTPACGFSESYEFEAADSVAAQAVVAAWPAQRRKWLAQEWKIVGFRLSSITFTLVSGKCKKTYKPVVIGACPGQPVGLLGNSDTPYTAVLIRISHGPTSGVRARNYLARGVPDTWWTAGALSIPAADGNKFLSWFNYMVGAGTGKAYALPTDCTPTLTKWYQFCVQRISSRRIGRPFFLLRGRQSKTAGSP